MQLFGVFYCCLCLGEVAFSKISANNEKCCLFLLVLIMHLKAFSTRGEETTF